MLSTIIAIEIGCDPGRSDRRCWKNNEMAHYVWHKLFWSRHLSVLESSTCSETISSLSLGLIEKMKKANNNSNKKDIARFGDVFCFVYDAVDLLSVDSFSNKGLSLTKRLK